MAVVEVACSIPLLPHPMLTHKRHALQKRLCSTKKCVFCHCVLSWCLGEVTLFYVVTLLDRTPIFGWCVAGLIVKNNHRKGLWYNEIGRCAIKIETPF